MSATSATLTGSRRIVTDREIGIPSGMFGAPDDLLGIPTTDDPDAERRRTTAGDESSSAEPVQARGRRRCSLRPDQRREATTNPSVPFGSSGSLRLTVGVSPSSVDGAAASAALCA
jgi:hypothetical protein